MPDFGVSTMAAVRLPQRGVAAFAWRARPLPVVRVALAAVLISALLGTAAEAARADFAMYPYTHNTSCHSYVDPITFVWYGRFARSFQSNSHTAFHARWPNREGSNQTFSSHGNCRTQHWQRASDCGICSRWHTRAGETVHQDYFGRWETVLTPHHEDTRTLGYWCHAVDSNGSKGSGFDKGRQYMIDKVKYTHHYYGDYANWGNTSTKVQCDGDKAGSNGWVAWFSIAASETH